MKKLLFLLFGALFALAGCADESGTNGGNTETCPISSADFSYERVAQNQYQMKLDNESKRYYASGVYWKEGLSGFISSPYDIEPLIEWDNGGYPKEATFYYNNNQCGETIIFKPKSTYSKCDDIIIDYDQGDFPSLSIGTLPLTVQYPNNFDYTNTNSKIILDNGIEADVNITTASDGYYVQGNFSLKYSDIENLLLSYHRYLYLDLVITFPDNTECVKELKYYIR